MVSAACDVSAVGLWAGVWNWSSLVIASRLDSGASPGNCDCRLFISMGIDGEAVFSARLEWVANGLGLLAGVVEVMFDDGPAPDEAILEG